MSDAERDGWRRVCLGGCGLTGCVDWAGRGPPFGFEGTRGEMGSLRIANGGGFRERRVCVSEGVRERCVDGGPGGWRGRRGQAAQQSSAATAPNTTVRIVNLWPAGFGMRWLPFAALPCRALGVCFRRWLAMSLPLELLRPLVSSQAPVGGRYTRRQPAHKLRCWISMLGARSKAAVYCDGLCCPRSIVAAGASRLFRQTSVRKYGRRSRVSGGFSVAAAASASWCDAEQFTVGNQSRQINGRLRFGRHQRQCPRESFARCFS